MKAPFVSEFLRCCTEPPRSANQLGSIWNFSWLLSRAICTPQRHLSYGTVGGFTVCKFFTESCVEVCRLITQGGVFTVFLAFPMGAFFSCNEASWTRKLLFKTGSNESLLAERMGICATPWKGKVIERSFILGNCLVSEPNKPSRETLQSPSPGADYHGLKAIQHLWFSWGDLTVYVLHPRPDCWNYHSC